MSKSKRSKRNSKKNLMRNFVKLRLKLRNSSTETKKKESKGGKSLDKKPAIKPIKLIDNQK